jgi:hypothetical protein
MVKGFPRDKFELGKGVLVGSGVSEIGNKGVDQCFSHKGGSQGSHWVVEVSWHC